MKLTDICNKLLVKQMDENHSIDITNIHYDSRHIQSNGLFICLNGHTVNGHHYIPQAIENGAVAVVVEEPVRVPSHISVITVPDTRRAMAIIADVFYQSPTSQLDVIGITGTNGKTTTSNLIQTILNDNQKPSGLIGTININYGDTTITSKNTTPDTLELQEIFHTMLTHEMSHVVMEVSSHALSMGRTRGTKFKTAVFTNLTQDHLDYHKTMEEYAYAKSLLFSQLGNHYNDNEAYAVLNNDDELSSQFASITSAQVITYGIHHASDVQASNIRITPKGTAFTVTSFKGNIEMETKLIGEFNVYNLLAAIATCLLEGLSLQQIKESLTKVEGVPGRFEAIYEGQPHTVIVDYAHTPDSLENVLQTARQFTTRKLTCVVGCGGDRDKTKRPIMASIAEKYSDFVILTSDNPRSEDPLSILNDMEKGMSGQLGKDYVKLIDRKRGIEQALRGTHFLQEGDVIVIAGKGHETYQIIGSETHHFDDREVAREIIKTGEAYRDWEPEDGVYATPNQGPSYNIRALNQFCLENGIAAEDLSDEQLNSFQVSH